MDSGISDFMNVPYENLTFLGPDPLVLEILPSIINKSALQSSIWFSEYHIRRANKGRRKGR